MRQGRGISMNIWPVAVHCYFIFWRDCAIFFGVLEMKSLYSKPREQIIPIRIRKLERVQEFKTLHWQTKENKQFYKLNLFIISKLLLGVITLKNQAFFLFSSSHDHWLTRLTPRKLQRFMIRLWSQKLLNSMLCRLGFEKKLRKPHCCEWSTW